MDNILTTLKLGLAAHLEKQGSSLEEFENSLATVNKAQGAIKVAGLMLSLAEMHKQAGVFGDAMGMVGKGLAAIPEMGLTTAMLAGTAGGAGMYGLSKYMDNQDSDINQHQAEVDRVKHLTQRLQQDYGIKPQHHNG